MNGLLSPDCAAAGLRLPRLWAGLALSCLLHALVVALPLLGERRAGTAEPAGAARPAPLAVTLTAASRPAAPAMGSAAAAATAAQPLPAPAALAGGDEPVASPADGADLLPIAAPAYYPTAQLGKRPQPAAMPELDAPELMPIVASGKLVVVLWIDDRGRVTHAEVERSDLPEAFAHAAIAAFRGARFLPGERDGRAVGSIMRIEASYDDHRAADR